MTKQAKTVPVTKRGVIQRIRRKLAKEAKTFHEVRGGKGGPAYQSMHCLFYSVDDHNHVCNPGGDDLEGIARDLEVLAPWEKLAEE